MNFQEEFNFNFWHQYYLHLEVERLELTIKHSYEIGWISLENYEFLSANLKMVKKYLKASLMKKRKNKNKRQDYWGKAYLYKQYFQLRDIKDQGNYIHLKQASLFDIAKPIPITGEIKVTGLNESLQALGSEAFKDSGPKFPYKIPAGTHWQNIIIKFIDDERIEIYVKKLKHFTDYKEMGMIGKGKVPVPSSQWLFLKVLAKCHGTITIKDPQAKDKYKKHKNLLSEILQNYFSIDYDPFYPYKSSVEKVGNSYKIKIMLLPPPEIKHTPENDEDSLGIQEFLNEAAPQLHLY